MTRRIIKVAENVYKPAEDSFLIAETRFPTTRQRKHWI